MLEQRLRPKTSNAYQSIVRVRPTSTLEPGRSTTGKRRRYNINTKEWADASGDITIHDPDKCNFLIDSDWQIPARKNPETGLYEIIGSWGIEREGKALEKIEIGGSGQVSVWVDQVDKAIEVTVHYDWIDFEDIPEGREVVFKWWRDAEKFKIIDWDCNG